ncbi:tRNA uridine-5-carboxymethylaminomethyl(34) synthesis GTPase MnmE [Ancylobacter lacus]|uniref:tRNA uridine-5-carboxymethylaminomethyl(34) synthesis GTPase MnmE n=1 Tax=Ancylobacter lacus TaxID=2579970 RepID=UPI001BCCACA9|nr:tRNA uridine-5-carboxymethylaminomethyl(34) synthesis GTPase MnmE [Ancylobacter lacus]MBS7537614.1 tRNA uridine-5-carboxymethylaminomethyl(34) synthesis GTPase MnmE [Ancylobacter lacus]
MGSGEPAGGEEGTIAAVSTAPGRAAVAVIRLSGPDAGAALTALAGRLPEPRRATLATLRDAAGDRLDQALVLWFPAPRSATGEDMAELQLHGGRAVVAAVLEALWRLPGLRPAGPGEFTRRAFLNGRMDLAAVEGLADLLAAETEGQRRLALAHAFGHLGARVDDWRRRLVRAMALVEAGIDFAEEEDIPRDARAAARPDIEALAAELSTALADRRGELVREGAHIAIAGLPNAGKSSLLNALAARDIAIVSDEPGTTRDLLEVALDLGGHKAVLIDTAGLREAGAGKVEAEGIRRARARIAAADLVLWVHDAAAGPAPAEAPDIARARGAPLWLLANKADRAEPVPGPSATAPPDWAAAVLPLSARTGLGLEALAAALSRWLAGRVDAAGEHPALLRARHRAAAQEVADRLGTVLDNWDTLEDELLAEELRLAAAALGRITGRIGVEDLLDVVFREFCVGK